MIQYAGKLSEKAFYLKEADTEVYSLEEINYFVYNHMNLIYRDFFSEQLFDYIETELERADLAERLKELERSGADLKSLVMCFLKESFYYNPQELSKISGFVMNINNISEHERMKIEGDNLFKERKYSAARSVYIKILDEAPEEGKGEFYADIAFRAGLCCANLFMCESACVWFNRAFEIFPKDDYAKASVYLSIVLENEEELLKAIIRYRVSDEALEKIRANVAVLRKSVLGSEGLSEFSACISDRRSAVNIAEGYKDEYYRMTE